MKTKQLVHAAAALLLLSTLNPQPSAVFAQGSLTPPGAPAPTMKTLAQIEPRTPISSLPYTITNSGAYYLTTNLTGVAFQYGIDIQADDVTIDLNGFALIGVPLSSSGVNACCLVRKNVCVRNGTIRNWSGAGIDASTARNSRFENLGLTANGGGGLALGTNCVATACLAELNGTSGGYGIYAAAGSVVDHCTAKSNNGDGIRSFSTSVLVSDCSAQLNTDIGINLGTGGAARDCTSTANGGSGIQTGDHCVVSGCSAVRNSGRGIYLGDGCELRNSIASTNVSAGIRGGDNCLIKDCTATKNGSGGIQALNYCRIAGCLISHNSGSFAIDVSTGSSVTDCDVGQNSGVGINTQNRCVVRGCHVDNNTGDGIDITADCAVANNVSDENNPSSSIADGLYVVGDRNTIDGNVLRGNGGYGIRLSANNNVIIRNNAKGNITGTYLLSGSNDVGPLGVAATATSPWANIQ